MKTPIYLDYAATTPVDERVAEAMCSCLTLEGNFANPASRSHVYGWKAEEAVENARNSLADLIACDAREIVWTSGATEANNLAIKGVVEAHAGNDIHIITSQTEHKSVLDVCEFLQQQGVEVTFVQPNADGVVTVEHVKNAWRENTVLVSLMHVNNEIGVINNIADVGQFCREKGVLLHVDGAQSVGKIYVDVAALNVDLMSISAHKMYGPKGQGALYIRRHPDVKVKAQIHGGRHERGMRSGTLATHQIVGLGKAADIAKQELGVENERLSALRNKLLQKIEVLDQVFYNGNKKQSVPGIMNLSFAGVDGESLLTSLRSLALSTGSACNSVSVESSYVLRALGVDDKLAHSSLRISLGRFTTEAEIDSAAEHIIEAVENLRARSPSWNMQKSHGRAAG